MNISINGRINIDRTIRLQKFETFQFKSSNDVTGSIITSNKPVAVFAGSAGAKIPIGLGDYQYIVEQMIPTKFWTTKYIVPPIYPRKHFVLKIFADHDNTEVHYYNSTDHYAVYINKGSVVETLFGTDPVTVIANYPISVMQYGHDGDNINGDPFMMTAQGVSQFVNTYDFVTQSYFNNTGNNTLAITITKENASELTLNKRSISYLTGKNISVAYPMGQYLTLFVNVSYNSSYRLSHSEGVKFGAVLYGRSTSIGAYGYPLQLSNSGMNCEVNIDDCKGNNCTNGSTCIDGINTYTCQCPPTHTGTHCEYDVDECKKHSDICLNGGTCRNLPGENLCVCLNGWTGEHCEINIDDCKDNPCFNGGTCRDRVGSFYCDCPLGKTGLRCHLDDACVSGHCKGNGSLCETSPFDGTPICTCGNGWTGLDCGTDINECLAKYENCTNTSQSTVPTPGPTDAGYTPTSLHTTNKTGYGKWCFHCEDIAHLKYCDRVQRCQNENDKCQNTDTNGGCLRCCKDNFCNSAGCGDYGFQDLGNRGPLCLDCSHIGENEMCNNVQLCHSDQACVIEKYEWGDNDFQYYMGCTQPQVCTSKRSVGDRTDRNVPVCSHCCHSDFCNLNCTSVDLGPALVG